VISVKEITVALLKAFTASLPVNVSGVKNNAPFEPVPGTPYEQALVLFAKPDNAVIGGDYFRENGILKIVLYYPSAKGESETAPRLDELRGAFKRGTTFVEGGSRVVIDKTPEIGRAGKIHDRWVVPVVIPWYSEAVS
jgi:hypothetical protein